MIFAFAGEYLEVEDSSPTVEVKQSNAEQESEAKEEQEKKEEAEKQARQLDEVESTLELAESKLTREAVVEAHLLASGLLVQKYDFNTRIQQVDSVVVEKERVVAEKAEKEHKVEEEIKLLCSTTSGRSSCCRRTNGSSSCIIS